MSIAEDFTRLDYTCSVPPSIGEMVNGQLVDWSIQLIRLLIYQLINELTNQLINGLIILLNSNNPYICKCLEVTFQY